LLEMNMKNPSAHNPGAPQILSTDGPGAALKQARERLNRSIEDVARALHLSPRLIEALERDSYQGLPPVTFVRGYLKNYARLLGLREQEIVEAYHRAVGWGAVEDVRESSPSDDSRMRNLAVVFAVVAVVALGGWLVDFWWTDRSPLPPASQAESETVLPKPEGEPFAVTEESPPAPAPAETAANVPAEVTEQPGTVPASGTEAPMEAEVQRQIEGVAPTPTAGKETPAPAAAPGIDTLVLRFEGDSWASVRDAEKKKLLYQTVRKGETKILQGKAPFRVTLGRPADARVEFNGKPFDHGYSNNLAPGRFTVPGDTAGRAPR
jgi:cytoskeleton protein RodZ